MIKLIYSGLVFLALTLVACNNPADDSLANSANSIGTDTVAIGQTLEYLLFSEGEPTAIKKLPDRYGYIESYYYRASHTTYTVNTETGHICNVTAGKHTGSCPPINE